MPDPTTTVSPVVPLERLDAEIERRIIGSPMPGGRRQLGLEYERLVLDRATDASAPLAFCRQLLGELRDATGGKPVVEDGVLKGVIADGYEFSMEPGGQLELAVPPKTRLAQIDLVVDQATALIEARLASTPYRLACYGHVPVTPIGEIGLLPRERYRIMDARMPARGPLSRNMMRATAGFQLTYDVADRDDAGCKLAILYRLSPVLVAVSANSRRIAGVDSGFASYRHHVWMQTDRDRNGVPEGCLQPETAIDGYLRYARRARALFVMRNGRVTAAADLPFETLVERSEITGQDLDLHLSSLFPFVRLRDYIEVRCFDTLDWEQARSILAFVSGLIYCQNAFRSAWRLSEPFALDDPTALHALHESVARDGLDAAAPGGGTIRDVARELVGFAGATLGGRNCDWAEPGDLAAVRARIG